MSESLNIIALVLIVLLVVVVIALILNRNIIQTFRLPWLRWELRTQDRNAAMSKDETTNDPKHQGEVANRAESAVNFGNNNKFTGETGDVAGRDIKQEESATSERKIGESTQVNFGSGNEFSGNVGDVAGRDIKK